jgi:hypothetical protein
MFAEWFTATTIAPVAEKLGGKLAESAKGPVGKKIGEVKLKLAVGFDSYIKHQIDRYSKIKTILGANVPLRLEYIYVNLYVSEKRGIGSQHERFRDVTIKRDDDLIDIGSSVRRIVFTATAGAGK